MKRLTDVPLRSGQMLQIQTYGVQMISSERRQQAEMHIVISLKFFFHTEESLKA
jgi:hypothetical protein